MSTTELPSNRRNHDRRGEESPRPSTSTLTNDVAATFARFGIPVSPSRISRMVRTYIASAQGNGYDFGDYVANKVVLTEARRRVVSDELRRVVSYSDPTGETAVRNVGRGTR